MGEKKTHTPINGVVEPDFLEYLNKKFQQWNDFYEQGISLGSREIANFATTVQGARLNAHFGFEPVSYRGLDAEGQECFTLSIYYNREAVKTGKPVYHFSTKIYSGSEED